MKRWYTLHTKPNAEYQVAAALKQRGVEVYLPLIDAPKAQSKRKTKPFFPCYLFSKVDLNVVGFSQLQWTPGLRRIISFDDKPTPLPDEAIDLVKQKLSNIKASGGWACHPFKSGDTVRITAGPLQDMVAIFDRPSKPGERVQVLLNILGHASRVEIDVADLEKSSVNSNVLPSIKPPRRTQGHKRQIKRQ